MSKKPIIVLIFCHQKLLDLKPLYALNHTFCLHDKTAENMDDFMYYAIVYLIPTFREKREM
jgi:hypothetical protein